LRITEGSNAGAKSATVYPRPGEPIDSVLKRFKRGCEAAEIIKNYRRKEFFISKSERRRQKRGRARRRRGDA
jgi:ribosomal protein S21